MLKTEFGRIETGLISFLRRSRLQVVRFGGRGGRGGVSVMPRLFFGPLRHETSLLLIEEPGCQWQQIYGPYSKCVFLFLCHSPLASCPSHFLQKLTNLAATKQGPSIRRPTVCKSIWSAHFCKRKIEAASDGGNCTSGTHECFWRFTEHQVAQCVPCYWCSLWHLFVCCESKELAAE